MKITSCVSTDGNEYSIYISNPTQDDTLAISRMEVVYGEKMKLQYTMLNGDHILHVRSDILADVIRDINEHEENKKSSIEILKIANRFDEYGNVECKIVLNISNEKLLDLIQRLGHEWSLAYYQVDKDNDSNRREIRTNSYKNVAVILKCLRDMGVDTIDAMNACLEDVNKCIEPLAVARDCLVSYIKGGN